jgi:hypothetical protein
MFCHSLRHGVIQEQDAAPPGRGHLILHSPSVRIPAVVLNASLGLALVPLSLVSSRGQAQATWSGTATIASAYVWRGVTTTNRPVIQPEVGLDVPFRGTTLSFGAWASVEPARYNGPSDISAVYGLLPGPAFTQYSAWAHVATELPGVSLSGGAETFLYPSVADLASLYNTVELTLSASLALPLAPTITAWYDVGAVRGAYFETSIWFEQQFRGLPVRFSLSTGINAGQGPDRNEANQAYFARKGITHLEFSATSDYHLGALVLSPSAHVIHGIDPWVRVTAPERQRSTKFWIGTAVSWRSRGEEEP